MRCIEHRFGIVPCRAHVTIKVLRVSEKTDDTILLKVPRDRYLMYYSAESVHGMQTKYMANHFLYAEICCNCMCFCVSVWVCFLY